MPVMTKKPPGLNAPWSKPIINAMSKLNTWAYRRTGGRIGGTFFLHEAPVLLLTTIGRKSGKERTAPLLYLEKGRDVIVVASCGGMDRMPLWFLNLSKTPEVRIQIDERVEPRIARVADDDEKAALWPELLEMYPEFESYQSWTKRNIPVVVLQPR